MMLNDIVLNADDVAKLLDVHPVTVRRLAKQDVIPARKVGKEWRFNKQSILQWLDGDKYSQQSNESDDERANKSLHSSKTHKVEFSKSSFLSGKNAVKEAQAQQLRSTRSSNRLRTA